MKTMLLALNLLLLYSASPLAAQDFDLTLAYQSALGPVFVDWWGLDGMDATADSVISARSDQQGTLEDLKLKAGRTRLRGLDLGDLTLHATLAPNPQDSRSELTLTGAAVEASAALQLPLSLGSKGNLVLLQGPLAGKIGPLKADLAALTRTWPLLALEGHLTLEGATGGTVQSPELDLVFRCPDLVFRGQPLGSLAGTLKRSGQQLELSFSLADGEGEWATGDASLGLDLDYVNRKAGWLDREPLDVEVKVTRLDRQKLSTVFRLPGGTDVALKGSLSAAGTLDRLAASAVLEGKLTVLGQGTYDVALRLEADPKKQTADLSFGRDLIVAHAETATPLVEVRRSARPLEPLALEGSLKINIPLPVLAPFLPDAVGAPEGTLLADLTLSGSLGSPTLEGTASVNDAAFTLVPLKRRLHEVVLELVFSGQRLSLRTFRGQGQPGSLEATGELELLARPGGPPPEGGLWSAWQAKGTLDGRLQHFPVLVEGLPVGLADAAVKVKLLASPGDTSLAATIREGSLSLTKEQLPEPNPVPANNSVRLLDWFGEAGSTSLFTDTTGRFVFVLSVPDGFSLKGGEADLTLKGDLKLTRLAELVSVEGGLEVLPGASLKLFGNDFVVKGGFLTLAEGNLLRESGGAAGGGLADDPDAAPEADPAEPVIKLVARALVIDTHVLVALRGPVRKPELVLASLPHLPEYSILSLLIMGTPDAVDDSNGEVRKKAAELVERFHNPGLKKQLFDRLGVDNLGLGFGSSVSQPIVAVGKQVTRTLYVETVYHHNAPPDTNGREGHVQYRLGRAWTFETVFGDAAEGSLGVFWGSSFGGPPPPPAPGDDWGLKRISGRPDGDGDGVPDAFDLCRGQLEDPDGFQDGDGCPDPDNDLDGVADARDAAPNEAETWNGFEDQDGAPDRAPFSMQNLQTGAIPLPFKPNSVQVGREHASLLQSAAALLAALPPLRLKILGHSDHVGTEAAKLKVSTRRAESVAKVLYGMKVLKDRVVVEGLGSTAPADPSFSEESRAANRRVTLQFEEAAGTAPGALAQ